MSGNGNMNMLKKLKETGAPVLKYFDPKKSVVIHTDASKGGLGVFLLQDGHPIANESRACADTKKNYAQIEKELLAIVFSVNRFHQYVYGVKVNAQSDHKTLETIHSHWEQHHPDCSECSFNCNATT